MPACAGMTLLVVGKFELAGKAARIPLISPSGSSSSMCRSSMIRPLTVTLRFISRTCFGKEKSVGSCSRTKMIERNSALAIFRRVQRHGDQVSAVVSFARRVSSGVCCPAPKLIDHRFERFSRPTEPVGTVNLFRRQSVCFTKRGQFFVLHRVSTSLFTILAPDPEVGQFGFAPVEPLSKSRSRRSASRSTARWNEERLARRCAHSERV